MSHALRHEPWLYELELDEFGWVSVDALLASLRRQKPDWSALSQEDLAGVILQSDKQRHELRDGRVRALYGHSMPEKLVKEPAAPPSVLFHGTARRMEQIIRVEGLQPMGRQYVHLSADRATAIEVGRRKDENPIVLLVHAARAHEARVQFYRGNTMVWLADSVPPIYLE
jgi:putative RNA 2'-phosphotransferase